MTKSMNPEVTAVKPQADFCLLVSFSSGERKLFDLRPFLNYPVYQKLRHAGYFARARVEHGTVVWDEQTDVSPDSLYLLGRPA